MFHLQYSLNSRDLGPNPHPKPYNPNISAIHRFDDVDISWRSLEWHKNSVKPGEGWLDHQVGTHGVKYTQSEGTGRVFDLHTLFFLKH